MEDVSLVIKTHIRHTKPDVFMEDKNHEPNDNVFVKETLIHLKYVAKTTKILQLKWRKMPTNVVHTDNKEYFDLKFPESYNEVLKKLEEGALDIKDIIHDSNEKITTNDAQNKNKEAKGYHLEIDSNHSIYQSEKVENADKHLNDMSKYKLLKKLAQMPEKQKEMQKVYEINKENLATIKDACNFPVLNQLFLQDIISKGSNIIKDEGDLNKYVDVQKSVEDGIILKLENGILTKEQKALLLSGKNFDNFTVPFKLVYLTEQLLEYKRKWKTKNVEELREVDEFGRTFEDRYRLLKQITKQIWYYTYLNSDDYT
ncbi:hypothetical protein AMK59_6723 [Oryctes borbonicus]|uniref:Uncharacterized protein n=1 Tax=Oryctes borbonicus TaxID=1629725 RepID=A0A0T6AXV5_9SCAR|nr:hypothetical protein AMK59_6723 [Oryctes borbonicus]